MSQLELESELSAASGSISRIENDQTNPTKETLREISHVLGLSDKETLDLFELVSMFPTEVEIATACAEVEEYLDRPEIFAYLIDEWAIMYAASKGFRDMLGLDEQKLSTILRKNLFELFFDPQYGIRQIIDESMFEQIMIVEVARMNSESNLHLVPGFERIMQLPGFAKVYELSRTVPQSEILSPKNKQVVLETPIGKANFTFNREALKTNSRFEIIEFVV